MKKLISNIKDLFTPIGYEEAVISEEAKLYQEEHIELGNEFRRRLNVTFVVIIMLTFLSPLSILCFYLFFLPVFGIISMLAIIVFFAYQLFHFFLFIIECFDQGVFRDSMFWKKLILPTSLFLVIEIPLAYIMYLFINSGG